MAVESTHVYEVMRLFDRKSELVHTRKMIFHKAAKELLVVDDAIKQTAMHTELQNEIVHDFKGIRKQATGLEICIEWNGIPDHDNFTWEPLLMINEDVLGVLQDFLMTSGIPHMTQESLRICKFND